MIKRLDIYGLLAEFDGPESLLAAAEKTEAAGYHSTDAFTPFPVHGMAEALGHPKTLVPRMVLIGGILGVCLWAWRRGRSTRCARARASRRTRSRPGSPR